MRLIGKVDQAEAREQELRYPAPAAGRARGSGANVLVVGGDKVFRESVALRIHRDRPSQGGLFTRIDCEGRHDLMRTSFVGILRTLTRQASRSLRQDAPLLGGGTIFFDPIDSMELEDQKACLELLKQLQARRNEWPERESVRVVAGATNGFSRALNEGRLLRSLVDILDKVRVVAGDGRTTG
ncbi:MAG: ATP-binding protein [Candidatus Eisenbacteria bacterium]|nr:ATP-binding protein [Candidatus Eisenbacteria bacterium]